MLVRLVDARNGRRRSAATGVRLSTEADVAVEVVRVGARDAGTVVARAVVAADRRNDKLNAAENRGLSADRRGDDVVGEVDILAHITENRLTGGL